MPKPRVTADSRQYGTVKDPTHWTANTEGESIGSEQDLNKLSFLYGAACDGGTDDMGVDDTSHYFGLSAAGYAARRKLHRYTLEQGSSTFAFPKKK